MTHPGPEVLPSNLPVPEDDGATAHLPGTPMPPISLPATDGRAVRVDVIPEGADRLILYAYPRTGDPPTADWDLIPGARGCTPEACGFRDQSALLRDAGAAVAGVSTQESGEQRELAARLGLSFPLLSDAGLALTRALDLPTFTVGGHTLLKRLTLVVREGVIERGFYPVFPPDTHAAEVVAWLQAHPVEGSGRSGSAD